MDDFNREAFIIPSFSELYGFRCRNESPIMADWLNKELQLIISEKEIGEEVHKMIQALWADHSVPAVERLKAVREHFKGVAALLEEAHAEAFCNSRLACGPETFTNLRISFCDEFCGGEWEDENCWGLINAATGGAGAVEEAALEECEDRWSVKHPLIEREIKPRSPFPAGTCDCGRIAAFNNLKNIVYEVQMHVELLEREAKRLIKYGH